MNEQTDKQASTRDLERMLGRIESGGLGSLADDELLEFGHMYRRAVSALSNARSQGVDDARIEALNHLVTQAYGYLYSAEPKGWPSVRRFYKCEFPQSFRRNLPFVVVAFLIFFGAALFAYGQVARDTGRIEIVLGPGAAGLIDDLAERHTGNRDWLPQEWRPVMSSGIMTNNITVAITAFSTGILMCLGTFAILFYNGLFLGSIAAGISSKGPEVIASFWSFVAPHGVIELTAIIISGGAGLMLGWALISPGEYTRRVALKLAGREALKLMLGVATMLVAAGIIEAFFSPTLIAEPIKLAAALMFGTAMFSYLFLAGKEEPAETRRGPRA